MRAHYVECKPSMDIWSLGVIIFEVRAQLHVLLIQPYAAAWCSS